MKNYSAILTIIIGVSMSLYACKNEHKPILVFEDDCTRDPWENWFLDGQEATVNTSDEGMLFEAGPDHGNDTSHAVLWTKPSFEGDIKIQYEYTRTDTTTRCVNILYFHAIGKGAGIFKEDIYEWRDYRNVPSMKKYFLNMKAYHISYAAFDARKYSGDMDYIRLRQYDPQLNKLGGTEILPDAFKTGLFKPFTTYLITVELRKGKISMTIANVNNEADQLKMNWDVSNNEPLTGGRIGLRHMYTRNAIYKNFKVWQLE